MMRTGFPCAQSPTQPMVAAAMITTITVYEGKFQPIQSDDPSGVTSDQLSTGPIPMPTRPPPVETLTFPQRAWAALLHPN